MTNVLIALHDVFAEYEFAITLLALRHHRVPHTVVGMDIKNMRGMAGLEIQVEKTLRQINADDYNALILPGMDGTQYRRVLANDRLMEIIRQFNKDGKLIAAIGGSPFILGGAGILKGHRFTSNYENHPLFDGAIRLDDGAVRDGHIITARRAYPFHFTAYVLDALVGEERGNIYREWAGLPEEIQTQER